MDLVGNLLIAPPAVKGNFWYKTVIMITEDHPEGNIGLVINKRSELTVSEFCQRQGYDIDLPGFLYIGGPVNPKSFSFLHTNDWHCNNTLRINSRFSLSSSSDILPRLAYGDVPDRWRMLFGICAWRAGQLNDELKGNSPWEHNLSWCTTSSNLDLVFKSDNKDQWIAALDHSGQEFAQNILT